MFEGYQIQYIRYQLDSIGYLGCPYTSKTPKLKNHLVKHVTSSSLMAGKVSSRVSELGIPQSQRMTLEGHDDLPGPHLWHPRWFTGHWRLRCLLQLKANHSKWWSNATKLQCTTAGSGETKALAFWRSDLVGTKQKQAMADSAQQWICHDVSFKIAKTNQDQTNDVKPSNYNKSLHDRSLELHLALNLLTSCRKPLSGGSHTGLLVFVWYLGKGPHGLQSRYSSIAQEMHR